MKRAGSDALDALEDLLQGVRKFTQLTEKKRGTFYRKSTAFLHFHEDPAGLFADLRAGDDWERLPVRTRAQRKAMVARLAIALGVSKVNRKSRTRLRKGESKVKGIKAV
jgi:hypothetical protein